MVRVFLKGGVWKNSEDEILKAAVQKYGKQQWARVASLLNRKTAKQAKARWHEWLDPSIRKTEWSRQEEEKLLHLAKLLPAQWKTIAPLVGRTAAQCQEHYERLLDQAAAATAGAGGTADADAELRNAALRPGQIDSHPETKPARPDPVDMDEDEMEMLQEARARLANTQGKKAKRKQREKMLAQAKRLADLQKRRELKQAGLLSQAAKKKASKRRREIDLGVEIPFHKPAPAGFHDTSAEDDRAERVRNRRLRQVDYKRINENQYRTRDREAARAKKREDARLRLLEQSNEKYGKQHADAEREAEAEMLSSRPRGRLNLPAPTVSDDELGRLAKIQQQQREGPPRADTDGPAATRALLSDYSDRPLPTPMRTPASQQRGGGGSTQETLMRSAARLRMLERGTTPLLGAAAASAQEEGDRSENEERAAEYDATPRLPDRAGAGRTPGSIASAPPQRDQLGLNRPPTELLQGGAVGGSVAIASAADDLASVGGMTFDTSKYSIRELARQERRAAKRARRELEAALAALPAPQFEYELAAPAGDEGDDVAVEKAELEFDRADVEDGERERIREEAERIYRARNSVVKRNDLPRPVQVPEKDADLIPLVEAAENDNARRLIQQEMLTLLGHDAHAFPVPPPEDQEWKRKKKKRKKRKAAAAEPVNDLPPEVPLDSLPERALDSARESIRKELADMTSEKIASLIDTGRAPSHEDALQLLATENVWASKDGASSMVYHGEGKWSRQGAKEGAGVATRRESVSSLRLEFETIQEATDVLKKRNDKLEAKLSVMNGGYAKRAEKFGEDMSRDFADLQNAGIEEYVYNTLRVQETWGGANRIDRLREEVKCLRQEEAFLQKRYGDLAVEKRRLAAAIQGKRKAER